MSYLSNPNIPLDLRTSAADAALAYIEAIAHQESIALLILSMDEPTDGLGLSYEDASAVVEDAHTHMVLAARAIANKPPVR